MQDDFGASLRKPRTGQFKGIGIDPDHNHKFPRDPGVKRAPGLIDDVAQSRCDVAMFAIGAAHGHRLDPILVTQ